MQYWCTSHRPSSAYQRRPLLIGSLFSPPPRTLPLRLIDELGLGGGFQQHRDSSFKLIMYVFRTYTLRFSHMFAIDLTLSTERTFNSCEGSNSGLSKFSSQRLSLNGFAEFVQLQLKRQHIAKTLPIRKPTAVDNILLCVQRCSKKSVNSVLAELMNQMADDKFKIAGINMDALEASIGNENISPAATKSPRTSCWTSAWVQTTAHLTTPTLYPSPKRTFEWKR